MQNAPAPTDKMRDCELRGMIGEWTDGQTQVNAMSNGMNAMSNGMKTRRKSPEYRYKKSECQHCHNEMQCATKRRMFCSDSCRSQFHRQKYQLSRSQIETAQIKSIAYVMQLEEAVIAGDRIARSAYEQIDKILSRVSQEIRRNEEIGVRLHRAQAQE